MQSHVVAYYIVVNGKSNAYDGIRTQDDAMAEIDWELRAKGLLKAELKRRGVTYQQLAEKLTQLGITEREENIRNKLARGKFTAVFLLQCLEAIGTKELRLDYGS
jgi:microsomal dipeptidase-like Zn-dependent dipeptidase